MTKQEDITFPEPRCFAISNTDGLYFAGWDVNGDAAWDAVSQACTYTNRLHAETQALLLVLDDDHVCRKAIELPGDQVSV